MVEIIIKALEKARLYPFNTTTVNYDKLVKNKNNVSSTLITSSKTLLDLSSTI